VTRARALLLAAGLLVGCVRPAALPVLVDDVAARRPLAPTLGARALDLSARRWPDGSVWRASQDRGAVVLLDVWATWCDPCRESLPFYDDVARQFAARGLKVYALSVDADAGPIDAFVKELGLTVPVLHDPGAAMAEEVLKVRQMPTSFLLDRRGVVRYVHEGLSEDFFQQTLSEVEVLLAEAVP
jgi:peroxiredoxin